MHHLRIHDHIRGVQVLSRGDVANILAGGAHLGRRCVSRLEVRILAGGAYLRRHCQLQGVGVPCWGDEPKPSNAYCILAIARS